MLNKRFIFTCIAILSLLPLQAQKVGLVLSGGGAKGAVHIGVIKALEDNDIPIDYIAGTSIGAIVGSLYAMGYTPDEMLDLFLSDEFYYWQSGKIEEDYSYFFRKPTDTPEFTKFTIPLKDSIDLKAAIMPTSLINPIQMNQAFMSLYAPATAQCQGDFNRLFVPFLCVASDVFNKTPVIFRSGDIGDAVRASMTFPFFFRPIIQDSVPLYDGGIYDNFPVKPMKQAFSPDFIIGCSVAGGNKKKPVNQDLYDQIENMIMQRTDYSIDPEDGVVLNFKLNNVSLLDFNKSRNLFRLGYRRGMQMVDSIKGRINSRRDLSEVNERRKEFRSQQSKMVFKNIYINGVNESQKKYIESQLHRNADKQFTMEDFKQSYFRLLADTKIKEIIPHAVYNSENNTFDLYLDVTVNDEIMIAFGGNISSSNANQLYIGLGYQSLTEYSTNINLDMQMGNTYNGVVLHGRLEVPSRIPLYLTGTGVYNYRKYYDSEKLFIDTELSTFIHQRETYGKLGIGLPFKTKAKIEMLFGYGSLEDKYYQSNTGSFFGTTFDRSKYNLFSMTTSIKKNTLDAKQYPILGQEHLIIAQYLSGSEVFTPAKSGLSVTEGYQSWVQLKGRINNYHSITPGFNLGYIGETVLSSKNLLSNYTSSVLQAPAFTPTLHSKMVFNESWHANQYIAGGITPIFNLSQTVHLRGDFDAFLPLYPIKRSNQGTEARYGSLFSDVSYLGELSFVVRLPFMSISLYGNYYNFPKDNWNFGINIGYLIFGPKFIQ